jgi:endogenous inhibitor of DNA gyrase (YacG/DUF329 family)
MGSKKKMAYEPLYCLVCGEMLEHKPTGRPRRFCSARCKQTDYRELRKWAKAAVEAALAGEPEPPKLWRWADRVKAEEGQG